MLLYLAGLQDIPRELYEAAAMDGRALACVPLHYRASTQAHYLFGGYDT